MILTPRLRIRPFTVDDAEFVLRLLNEPSWIRFIGDRGIRTVEGARTYLETGPIASVARHGFGLYAAELLDGTPIGMAGLIKRDTLEDVDIGFALFPAYWGQGYAREASNALLDHARQLGMARLVAITDPKNDASIRVLEGVGFRFERIYVTPQGESLNLYGRSL